VTVESPPGVGIEATLDLLAGKVGEIADRVTRAERREVQLWQDVHMVPILGGGLFANPLAGATLDFPDRYGPHDPFWWDVRRLSCWGFTAGTVNVFLNDPQGLGELVATYPSPGQWTWGGNLLLAPRDRLVVVVGSNITGQVQVAGQAAEVSSTMLPRYLL